MGTHGNWGNGEFPTSLSPQFPTLFPIIVFPNSIESDGGKILWVGITVSNCTLFINDKGELLAFKLTPGNTDDRKPVPDLTQDLIGKLERRPRLHLDRTVWKALWTRTTVNYPPQEEHEAKVSEAHRLAFCFVNAPWLRPLMTNSRTSLKSNIPDIEVERNFMVNLFAGLIAYTYLPQKPSLDLEPKGLPALPPALF